MWACCTYSHSLRSGGGGLKYTENGLYITLSLSEGRGGGQSTLTMTLQESKEEEGERATGMCQTTEH
jgi:hypothetical protein